MSDPSRLPILGSNRARERAQRSEFEAAAMASALERISPDIAFVERCMGEQFDTASQLVSLIGDHVLGSGGKRIRPALVLLAAELCGYTGPRRIHIAAAIELMHCASLVHDDVVDFSELRRGRPSANALWGNRRAVLAGDFFYARASSIVTEDGNADILWVFVNAIRAMSEGELLQLERSFDTSVTEAHYFSVIEHKSAVLLSAACESGSILGGVTRAERRKLSEFGRELGIAFQLRDDALDYESGEEVMGKSRYADLREGKVTMPLLLTLKRCAPAERAAITGVLKAAGRFAELNPGAEAESDAVDLSPVIELVDKYRGIEDTVRRADKHVARAEAAIAPFPDCRPKEDMLSAVRYSVSRDR